MKIKFITKVTNGMIFTDRRDLTPLIGRKVTLIINNSDIIDGVLVHECRKGDKIYGRIKVKRQNLEKYNNQFVEVEVIPVEDKSCILNMLLNEVEKEKRFLRFIYAKHISFREFWEAIRGMTLEEKVDFAHRVVEEAIRITKSFDGKVIASIAFSGGKASLTMLDIVAQHRDEFDELYVYYHDTLNEYPGNTQYVINVVKNIYKLPLIVSRPKITPWQLWKTFGFPKTGRLRGYLPVCCLVLKELPTSLVIDRFNINLEFTGIQFNESMVRSVIMSQHGLVIRTQYIGHMIKMKKYVTRAYPIALFTDFDLWTYIKRNNLPINSCYERFKVSRQGCIVCTNNVMWRENIVKINPKLLQFVEEKMREWGIQEKSIKLSEIKEKLGVKNWEELYEIKTIN